MKALIQCMIVAAGFVLVGPSFADNAAQADGKALKQEGKEDKAAGKELGKEGDRADAKALKKQGAEEKKAGKKEQKAGNKE